MLVGVVDVVVVGVTVDVGDVDVGLGVAVAFGVGFFVGVGLFVGEGARVAEGVASMVGVGVTKIIFIAPSSGIGDTTFLLEITAPAMTTTSNKAPTIIATAATVFCRSFIRL